MQCELHHPQAKYIDHCLQCVMERAELGTLADGDLQVLIARIKSQAAAHAELAALKAEIDKEV